MNENEEDLRRRITELTGDGRVACKALLNLAAEIKAPPKTIGRLCDEMNIRISRCQLGCFD